MPGVVVFYRCSFNSWSVSPDSKISFIHRITRIMEVCSCIVNSMIPYDSFQTYLLLFYLSIPFVFISPTPLMGILFSKLANKSLAPFYFSLYLFHTLSPNNTHLYFHVFYNYYR